MARKDDDRDDELENDEESLEGEDASEREPEDSDDDAGEDDADEEEEVSEEAHSSRIEEQAEELAAEARQLAHQDDAEDHVPQQLGAIRYVHAAFFGAGILVAYLSGKLLTSAWNSLADWPTATRAVPFLLRFAEDDRASYMQAVGAVIGILAVVQTYRKETIHRWANEVAVELSKVTWPNKETVQNGTLVVIVASAIATFYVAVLDRVWGFLTHLVYGA